MWIFAVSQILFIFIFKSFEIYKLFPSIFVKMLAPQIYSYFFLQEKQNYSLNTISKCKQKNQAFSLIKSMMS